MLGERLACGELIEVLADLRPPAMPIAAVMPSARMVPSRVRALLDLLAQSAEAFPAPPSIGTAPRLRRRAA